MSNEIAHETFDDIVAKYEANPIAFIEEIVRDRFEYPATDDPYCTICHLWGEVSGRPLLIERKYHKPENLRDHPKPHHRFERKKGWFLICGLTREQLVKQIERGLRMNKDIDLLRLYLREKFVVRAGQKPSEEFQPASRTNGARA